MQRHRYDARLGLAFLLCWLASLFVNTAEAQKKPSVPEQYQKFFVHYVDERSYLEKIMNSIGLTNQDIGRSFALIAGVSYYPNMSLLEKELKPAAEDLRKLEDYLKRVEFFNEIVVLENEEMNYGNLAFFLQSYFPKRLRKFPKSRFLFAYSGHGITEGANGYLLLNTARSLSDKESSLNLQVVRVLFDELVESGHHVLALLNACYSGAFIRRSFGDKRFIPKHKGAHAITAGGTQEQTWHDPQIGSGSIFFEKLFAGLDGHADILPKHPDGTSGDGLIAVDELATYLRQEVQIFTDQIQNPQVGDLSKHGSRGGFFFLDRRRQVDIENMREWNSDRGKSFGRGADESLEKHTGEAIITGGNTLAAREQALKNAFRKAVEKAVGVLLDSKTLGQNMQLISDNIYSKSQAYLKNHEILKEGPRNNSNNYFVTIRAPVNIAEIATDLWSQGTLQDIMGSPKILSMIEEISDAPFGDHSSASIALEETLNEYNFDLVDREQVKKIREDEFQRMGKFFMDKLMEDPIAIKRIAKKAQEYGAQYLLMGKAFIEPGSQSGAVWQANATFSCKVVDASTAEKVALTQKAESGRGNNANSAILYAGQRVGEVAAVDIIPQIIQNWLKRANQGVMYIIKLYGVTSYRRQGREFIQTVKNIPGVTNCTERLWDAKLGRLEIDVTSKGVSGADLIHRIFDAAGAIPGFENLELEERTGNNINFTVK